MGSVGSQANVWANRSKNGGSNRCWTSEQVRFPLNLTSSESRTLASPGLGGTESRPVWAA